MSAEIERLVRLEIQQEHMKASLDEIKAGKAETDAKLDQLLAAAAMGQGAWWLLIKLGSVGVALATAGAWLYEHIPGVTK